MEPTVYLVTVLNGMPQRIIELLPNTATIVCMKPSAKSSDWPDISNRLEKLVNCTCISLTLCGDYDVEVPELEDDALASKIEYMFVDLPVLARYRKKLVNLKWAHTAWNGVDQLVNSFEKDEPYPNFTLTKTPGSLNAAHITEYVIGYVIATERRFFEAMESQQKSKWQQLIFAHSRSLSSLTIGILGVGEIGKHLAKVCKTFGMTVWGLTRRVHSPENRCEYIDVYRTADDLVDLLKNCDYICNVLPSTPRTEGILSGDVLKHCEQKKSVFINVGRGDVVDDESIVRAINNGWLGGAVLDVFKDEPLSASSPLWTLPEVIVTPHVSGWSSERKHVDRIAGCFVDNYHRYLEGRPLEGVFDWSQGY